MFKNVNSGKTLCNALLLCLYISVFAGCDSKLTPAEGIHRATDFRGKGNYNAAIIELKNTLRENPQHRDSRLLLSQLYILKRDGDDAETQLHKAQELSAERLDIRSDLGKALLLQEDYDRVINEIAPEEADPVPVRADLLSLRAFAYLFNKDIEQASRTFQEALSAQQNNASIFVGLAMIELDNGNYETASQRLEQALKLDTENMDALIIKGSLALKQKQLALAVDALKRAVSSVPKHFTFLQPLQAHVMLVQAYIDQGELERASQVAEDLAKSNPNNPLQHYLRAHVAYESGDIDGAKEQIKIIRSVAPDFDPALVLEGAINYASGNLEQSNSALTSYLTRHPESQIARKLLAATRLKLKQPEDAYELISPLLNEDPDNFELLLMAGDAMRYAGKPGISIPLLEKALLQDPDNVELKMQLAAARLSSDETDAAIRILQALPPTQGEFGKREQMLLLSWSRIEDYASALSFVNDYMQANPQDPDVPGFSGVLLARMKRPDEARVQFEKSLSLKADNKPVLIMLAHLEYQAKNFMRSEELLIRLSKMEPDNDGVFYALANISADRGDNESAIMWLERARAVSKNALKPRLILVKFYLERGDISSAKEISIEATKIAPQRSDVWNTYSVVQNKSGDPKGAVDSLRKAENLEPDSIPILTNLAQAQVKINDLNSARDTLNKLLKLSPDNFPMVSLLAIIEMKQGNAEQALNIAQRQQSVASNRPNALALEGDLRMMSGEFNKALDRYQAAAKISSSAALSVKIYSASNKAAIPEPEQPLLQWLKLHPDDMTIRSLLGNHYAARGDATRAVEQYEIYVKQKPDDPSVLNNLALSYHLIKHPKAIEMAERAHKLSPDNAAIKDTFGWILIQEKELKRGLPLLREATEQLPENMEMQYHYAVALAESGDRDEARKLLQKVLDSNSSFPAIEAVKKYLEAL